MATPTIINGGSYNIPGPGRDFGWNVSATNVLVALSANAGRDLARAIFVDGNGDDTFDGLTQAKGVQTLAQALTLANALTPTSASPVSIIVMDASVFTEDISIPSNVFLHAPVATIDGTVIIADDASIDIFEVKNTGSICIIKTLGSGSCNVTAKKVTDTTGVGIDCDSGIMNVKVDVIDASTALDPDTATTINAVCISVTGSQIGAGTLNLIAATTAP